MNKEKTYVIVAVDPIDVRKNKDFLGVVIESDCLEQDESTGAFYGLCNVIRPHNLDIRDRYTYKEGYAYYIRAFYLWEVPE